MRFASFSLFASVLACFALAGTSRAAQTYELGSLELQSLTQDWGEPHSNKSVDGRELSIGGRKFERGLGTHAVSTFRRVVTGLSAEQLAGPHPETRFGPVLQALVHLVAHFAIHRGQMSYIVRLL